MKQETRRATAGVLVLQNEEDVNWFNKDQRKNEGPNGDYRVEKSKAGVTAFRTGLKKGYFGRP